MSQTSPTQQLRTVESLSGSGTSLISLYIPAGKELNSVRQRLVQEQSEAENIKSDTNRQNVQSSLRRAIDVLDSYGQTPENGLVIFTGPVEGEMETFVFDSLPEPLNHSTYHCGREFQTDEIEAVYDTGKSVGLAILERGGVTIGETRGSRVIHHQTITSDVMSMHTAGGQSQTRFRREIERQKHEFFIEAAEAIEERFYQSETPDCEALIIGGSKITVDDFQRNGYLRPEMDEVVVDTTFSVGVLGKTGLEQLMKAADDTIQSIEQRPKRDAVDALFERLHACPEKVAYGRETVKKAVQYGAVETLLVSNELSEDSLQQLVDETESKGGDTIRIPNSFERGEQLFHGFGGYAALLRYPIGVANVSE